MGNACKILGKYLTGIVMYVSHCKQAQALCYVETVQEAQMQSKYHSMPLYNGECYALKVLFATKKEELTQF